MTDILPTYSDNVERNEQHMMHEKLREEFKRVFETLIATDPGDPRYKTILNSFELLDSIGPSINDFLHTAYIVGGQPITNPCNEDCADCPNCEDQSADREQTTDDNITEFPTPAPMPHEEEPQPTPQEEPLPTLTPAEVRSRLAAARRAGVNVAAIIKEFGADNFTALPATKYRDLLERVENESGGMD